MLTRIWRTLISVTGLVVIVAGIPLILIAVAGQPIPDQWPTGGQWQAWAANPVTLDLLPDYMACAGWLLWALLVAAILAETLAAVTQVRVPKLRFPAPIQAVAASIVGTIVLAAAGTAARAATPPPTAATTAAPGGVSSAVPGGPDAVVLPAAGHVVLVIGDCSYPYKVHRNDNLSKIAKKCLGNPNRWPEIWRLNKGRYWPHVSGHTRFRDPDVIYPGWVLTLPADAKPPRGTTRITTPPSTPAPDTQIPSPGTTPTQGATTPPDTPTAAGPDAAHPTPDGISLPGGSFLPWTLVVAITSAWTLTTLRRRRYYQPGNPATVPPLHTPSLVRDLRRALATRTATSSDARREPAATLATPDELARIPAAPHTLAAETIQSGGSVGTTAVSRSYTGPGAPHAVRGALLDALTAGSPGQPTDRVRVVIPAATLTALLGADAATLATWPRLTITADLDQALQQIEVHLLSDARRRDDPDSDPPASPSSAGRLLLIAEPPDPAQQHRAQFLLDLAATAGVTGIWLGNGPTIDTIHIDHDGTTHPQPSPQTPPIALLDTTTAITLLHAIGESQPFDPAPSTHPVSDLPTATVTGDAVALWPGHTDADHPKLDPAPVNTHLAQTPARLRVLGVPGIDNITLDGRPLRAKALELAVYLACHTGGADTRQIGEDLEPDAKVAASDQRVHTNISNLRHNLARAAGPRKNSYIIQTRGRYHLDPATVTVDLWEFTNLANQASLASGEQRRDLLHTACNLYQGPLADGHDYEWIEPHRENHRRQAIDIHLQLADELTANPAAAAEILDRAIRIDPYNEHLYRLAMRARHRLGDTDTIATLLRTLTHHLRYLDSTPTDETLQLARQLLSHQTA